jgi:hypothetical protein
VCKDQNEIFRTNVSLETRTNLVTLLWTFCERKYADIRKDRQKIPCNILGFHGSDYEECHPLGFKNPVRTSQETHYISATEPSRLMLCNI